MYKLIKTTSLITILVLFYNSFADPNDDYNIYFCTRDLDHPSLLSSGISTAGTASHLLYGLDTRYVLSYAIIDTTCREQSEKGVKDTCIPFHALYERDNAKEAMQIKAIPKLYNQHNTIFRHCFVMLGQQDNDRKEEINRRGYLEEYRYFKKKATYNFFGTPNGADTAEERLRGQIVSCQAIKSFDNGNEAFNDWNKILKYFENEKSKGYNAIAHNCCTVAYGSIFEINGDISEIDQLSFNLGIGTKYQIDVNNFWMTIPSSISENTIHALSPSSPSGEREKKQDL